MPEIKNLKRDLKDPLATTYEFWEAKCNGYMLKKYAVGIDDIPDQSWYEWYKDGWTVKRAVEEAIEYTNNGEWI